MNILEAANILRGKVVLGDPKCHEALQVLKMAEDFGMLQRCGVCVGTGQKREGKGECGKCGGTGKTRSAREKFRIKWEGKLNADR